MVSALLDELPCLVDEADELMARLSCLMTLLKMKSKGAAPSPCAALSSSNQETIANSPSEDRKQPPSPRHSTSPMGRTRTMTETRQTLDDVDMDAIIKFFARQYVTMQSMSFEKMNANLPSDGLKRGALHTVAASVYQLMKRLQHWQQAAWDSLSRFFADNSNSDSCLLTFDSHPQLTRLVLATVAKYVKANLLWSSFSAIPGLLALYSFLHHVQTTEGDALAGTGTAHAVYSPLEHTDHRVREFVLHFGTAPLLAIQHDFQLRVADKGASLAALALSCFERYEACRDVGKLRNQGVFNLEPLVSGAYAAHSSLPDLLNASDVADWVICVVLCVPHQLQADEQAMSPRSLPSSPTSSTPPTNPPSSLKLWDFMDIIARDRLVFTLHRNHVVNLHDLLYQQVTSSLSAAALTSGTASSSSIASFGSSRASMPLKKSMSALSKFALRNCGVNHRQRREVATWLVQNCVQLMRHNPALVGPSFPLLLAALAIACDEVEWGMSHGARNANADGYKTPLLPSHVKAKHLQRVRASFTGAEREVADLLTHCHRLRGLLEQHSHFIAEYYQVFLVNGDADGIAYTIQELLAANGSATELQSLLEGFLDAERYRVNTSSSLRVTWVREWRQANAHLVTRAQLPLLDVLRARMECAVRHTQYVCVSSQLIEHTATFSKCWWFRDVVFEQSFEQTSASAPSSAIGLLEILSSLAVGNYVLDELVDTEEATQQSERMLQCMDRMRTRLVDQVERELEAVVKRDTNLQRDESSTLPEEKSQPLENKLTASSRRLSSFSRVQSSHVQRPSSAELRLASPTSSALARNNDSTSDSSVTVKPEQVGDEKRCVGLVRALLDHIGQHQGGTIVQTAIVERVQASFVRFLRGCVTFPGPNATLRTIEGVMLRCSVRDACERIRCFLRATRRLFGGSSSELDGINKAPLGEAVQTVLAKVLANECSASTSILPQDKRLLEWATDPPRVSEKDLEHWSLVDRVSWLFVCLVTRRCHPLPSSSPSAAVLSPPVLAAVRKGCFVLSPGASGEQDPREYTSPETLQHLVTFIGSAGVESVRSTIANLLVAQALKLRSSIEAEHAVLAFMDMAMSGDVILAAAQGRALDDIATQLVQIGTAAFLLQLLHAQSAHETSDAWEARVAPRLHHELQQDPDRRATWTRLLPVACRAGFHSSVWKRTTYWASAEATDTNAHMMGLAMALLLPSPQSSRSVHRCAVAALKRTAACSEQPSVTRPKLPLQLEPTSSASSTRPLLEALELLVTTAAPASGDPVEPHGSSLGELELSLERLLPHAVLALHPAA
ncbi:Nck-associated protein 1-like [Phytophthora pseudosyringae]|uniref:Nck-associated protein 1-like n=1 Tax=Phytophthora pseudosyringae TaxID=221518 RepID=A0A8T1WKM2_9STRA|nr:Nck-associated protein 1-like [Phytophthora pseudosyringae]